MVPADPMLIANGDLRGPREPEPFGPFVAEVRVQIDARLARWLESRMAQARARGPEVAAVAEAVAQVALRGGKRIRAALLAAAYLGCDGEGGIEAVAPAGAALELLQAYLLAHDDWMDADDVRRGGPSVPAAMFARFGKFGDESQGSDPGTSVRPPSVADAASVLAGDLAGAWALASMLEVDLAPARVALALRELARVEEEVVHGQILDVCGATAEARDVEAGYALKTASYTVRGPVVIGARLAGANDGQVAMLAAFAEPLGVAFQLRDDLLGTFGDARAMGKPAGGDLRKGKQTALVIEAMGDPQAAKLLHRVLGRCDASEEDTRAALCGIVASGAAKRVEDRIAELARRSMHALDQARVGRQGRALLARAVVALTERDR